MNTRAARNAFASPSSSRFPISLSKAGEYPRIHLANFHCMAATICEHEYEHSFMVLLQIGILIQCFTASCACYHVNSEFYISHEIETSLEHSYGNCFGRVFAVRFELNRFIDGGNILFSVYFSDLTFTSHSIHRSLPYLTYAGDVFVVFPLTQQANDATRHCVHAAAIWTAPSVVIQCEIEEDNICAPSKTPEWLHDASLVHERFY